MKKILKKILSIIGIIILCLMILSQIVQTTMKSKMSMDLQKTKYGLNDSTRNTGHGNKLTCNTGALVQE